MPVEELADRLGTATCEVERIIRRGVADDDGNLGLFRVGRVVEAGKHPNADRLQLCRVDVGEGEPRQIVCGAWNFGAGATVAVALPGAVLPNGLQLEQRKVRGELSDGMILAEDEVDLGTDHSGIMVLPESEPGTPLVDVLPLVDDVLLVESTGNRPDLLSIYGIAREVAALYGLELEPMSSEAPQASRRRKGRHRDRGLRGLPALHRPALSRRLDWFRSGLAQGPLARRWDAADLERRRRDELRDARARQPAARVRLPEAARRQDRRPARAARREVEHPRRCRPRARADRPDDRGRRS